MKSIFTITTVVALLVWCAVTLAQDKAATSDDSVCRSAGFQCPGKEVAQRPIAKFNLGDVTKSAVQMPQPKYPQLAKTSGRYGDVKAEVIVNINSGRVAWAQIISGHPLLKAAVSDVVCKVRFAPTNDVDGFASGILTYRFPRRRWFRITNYRNEKPNNLAADGAIDASQVVLFLQLEC